MSLQRIVRAYERFLFLLVTGLCLLGDLLLPIVVGWFVAELWGLPAGIVSGVILALVFYPAGVLVVTSSRRLLRMS